jgi:hypothetical protein
MQNKNKTDFLINTSFQDIHQILGKTKKIKLPSASVYPNNINPEAIGVWKSVIKTKQKRIKATKDSLEKWAVSILLFQKACKVQGIKPFGLSRKIRKTRSPILLDMTVRLNPLLKVLDKVETYLMKNDVLGKTKPKLFKLGSVQKKTKNRIVRVTTTKSWKVLKKTSPEVLEKILVSKFGFKKDKPRSYIRRNGPSTRLVITYKKNSQEVFIILEFDMSLKLWKALEDTQKNPEKHINGWLKRGFKATAKSYRLKDIYPIESKEDIYTIYNTVPLSQIVNLGNLNFQLKFLEYLKKNAESFDVSFPEHFELFLNDPDFRDSMSPFIVTEGPRYEEITGPPMYPVEKPVEDKSAVLEVE